MELLMLPRMLDLLEKKWNRYAAGLFLRRFFFFFSYLLIFAGMACPLWLFASMVWSHAAAVCV